MSNASTLVAPIQKANSKKVAITSFLTSKGAGLQVTNLPENVTGAQVEKVKRQLSALVSAKIEANNSHKAHVYGFKFNLDSFKTRGTKYLSEFNSKHGLKVTMSQVMGLSPELLSPFMTDKQKEVKAKNGNRWSFWDIETLVAKYFAPIKVAKVKKAK
jgi:hypothetical protein